MNHEPPTGDEAPSDAAIAEPSDAAIAAAVEALRRGEVVAVPTDTVYGLAVDPLQPGASARIFSAKRRPEALALPVLVASFAQASLLAAPASLERLVLLATAFWPGALTVVVQRAPGVELDLGGDSTTVGLRAPAHPAVRELCRIIGPLAVTSANLHGMEPCHEACEVRATWGDELTVIDGGRCDGRPSTVVAITGAAPVVLREGPVSAAEIEAVLAR